jgi:hypothetical protein
VNRDIQDISAAACGFRDQRHILESNIRWPRIHYKFVAAQQWRTDFYARRCKRSTDLKIGAALMCFKSTQPLGY